MWPVTWTLSSVVPGRVRYGLGVTRSDTARLVCFLKTVYFLSTALYCCKEHYHVASTPNAERGVAVDGWNATRKLLQRERRVGRPRGGARAGRARWVARM